MVKPKGKQNDRHHDIYINVVQLLSLIININIIKVRHKQYKIKTQRITHFCIESYTMYTLFISIDRQIKYVLKNNKVFNMLKR